MKRQIIKTRPQRPYRVARLIIAIVVLVVVAAVAWWFLHRPVQETPKFGLNSQSPIALERRQPACNCT